MSWSLLTQYETLSQPKVFICLVASLLLFIVTIIIIPIANVDFNESESSHHGDTLIIGKYNNLITVSIIFGAYQFINSLIEWISVFTMSSSYYFDSKHEYQINQTTPNVQSISPLPHVASANPRKPTRGDVQQNQSYNPNNLKDQQPKDQQIQRFQSNPPSVCNRYLIMRWLIGSLTNITNYLHILFISLALTAYFQSTNISQGKNQKVKAPGSSLEIVWLLEIIIAICAIVAGNIGRVKFLARYIFLQPHIYFLLPMTQRNIHLAWILNLQVLAISFESISLSEYMIALGGPVMPGKKKDNVLTVQILEKNKVESLQDPLASAKYKYQDMPMILVLLVHIIIGIAVNSQIQTGAKSVILDVNHQYACFAALGLTVLQVLIIRADLQWPRENKEVDINNISEALKIRQAENEKRKIEINGQSLNKIENSHETGGEKSSNYTSRSIISNGIGDVMRELEQLNNEDNQLSPTNYLSPTVQKSEQIINEANQKLVNLSQNIN